MIDFNAYDVAQKIIETIQKEYKELNTFNVMILGKTGVGKSTLINNMFNRKMADIGVGKPITKEIKKITLPDFPLAIYDTPGLELGGEFDVDHLLEAVEGEILKGIKSGNISNAIHCILYCISTPTHRVEQTEIDFLKQFLGKTEEYEVPVIVVLTQSYSKKDASDLKREIEKENLPIVNIVPVLAENYEIDEDYTAKAYGLDKLSEIIHIVSPEAVQKTFVAVQRANIELKKVRAQAVVASAAAGAAAIGATPIPFTDAAVLVPEQIAMIGGITAVFGVPMDKGTMAAVVSATIGTTGTTVLGKTIVAGILKCIPGVGSVVGGVISATTAAALTTALGEAYIVVMVRVCKGEVSVDELRTEKGKMEMAKVFLEKLKLKRNSKGEPSN